MQHSELAEGLCESHSKLIQDPARRLPRQGAAQKSRAIHIKPHKITLPFDFALLHSGQASNSRAM